MKRFESGAEVATAFIALRESKGLTKSDVAQRYLTLWYGGRQSALYPSQCQVDSLEDDRLGSIEFIGRDGTLLRLLESIDATQAETDEFLVRCGVVPKDVIEILIAKPELFGLVRADPLGTGDGVRLENARLKSALGDIGIRGHESNCAQSGPAFSCKCESWAAKKAWDARKGVGET